MTEENDQIKVWREKAANGTLSIEDLKEAVKELRGGRVSSCFASAGAQGKKVKKEKKELLKIALNNLTEVPTPWED